MLRLASALVSRRRFATATAIGTIGRAVRTSPKSRAKLPVWPIGRRKICGLPGASCIDTGPPLGLSRDLLIRALAYQLQERSHGGVSRALRRRLQSLVGASDKGTMAVDPGLVLKPGTTLVRQWRGHTHTVLVHKDGFEHEGQRYRSLTAIAERITEAHWSGPRFFGLTKRARALARRQDRPMTRPTRSGTKRNARVRCAIYTRKSSEEGLEQEFNSLHAQREACEAFISSQRHEGWVCLPQAYDDGGFSGGNMERPALQRLLADIRAGQGRYRRRLQDRPADPLARRLCQDRRDLRCARACRSSR